MPGPTAHRGSRERVPSLPWSAGIPFARPRPRRNDATRDGLAVVLLGLACLTLFRPCWASPPLAEPLFTVSQPGPATSLALPMGVAVDTTGGLVIIADSGNHRIRIFDLDGYPITSFLHKVDGLRGPQLGEPKSVAIDRQGTLYILDTQASYVSVMDLLGNPLGRIAPRELAKFDPGDASSGDGDEAFMPVALALDPDDRLVLAVGGLKSRIWLLDHDRSVRLAFDGGEGVREPLGAVSDLFVDHVGRIYVTDATRTPAVRVFSPGGQELLAFGQRETGNENFSLPAGVVATDDGRIWVVDTIRQMVKVFSPDGAYLGMFGGLGRGLGDFTYPTRLATDGRRRLYVLEKIGARLTVFDIPELAVAVSP